MDRREVERLDVEAQWSKWNVIMQSDLKVDMHCSKAATIK